MMDFITPHAILLSKENLRDIHYTTGAQYESLNELLDESATSALPFYIVAQRDPTTGLPKWECMTQIEFALEYPIVWIDPRIKANFTKM